MAYEEKSAWIMLLTAVASYATYLVIVLGRLDAAPAGEVRYVETMLWTIGWAIIATIVLHIVAAISAPRDAGKRDERDREIYRRGEYIGQSMVIIGGVGALALALAEVEHFWIANALYLGFSLSGVLGSVAKIVAYRRGFQSW